MGGSVARHPKAPSQQPGFIKYYSDICRVYILMFIHVVDILMFMHVV